MFDWSKESTIRLIKHYHSRPSLWDPRNYGFTSDVKRNEAWNEISILMKSEKVEVERKMRSLLFQYKRELYKATDWKFGDGTPSKHKRRWYAMKSLSFLSGLMKESRTSQEVVQKEDEMKDEKELTIIVPQDSKIQYPSKPKASTKDSSGSKNSNRRRSISRHASRHPSIARKSNAPQKNAIAIKQDNSINEEVKMTPETKSANSRDEYNIFGEHVACKLRNLPTQYSRVTVEHYITNILHQAKMGEYDFPPTVKTENKLDTKSVSLRKVPKRKELKAASSASSATSASGSSVAHTGRIKSTKNGACADAAVGLKSCLVTSV